ncbi:hypothetical protein BU24DRAFT_70518 [Aaosphaeria arxii CBS 175.79]|uniref:F-box domain-containing protein n=1 Tax=Aaosphaeria arxii CBS 175.79 TaxID=1450172 RepID=A0A6A5XBF8_9PLEO|nr:uncharacterized protein BU24DRAFT_70518 [Aaosphaeria arxii CBS 175.79]KAF2010104.1 hypothetical protein BU24DRAFT_70518 [Aaosphaeria arxii CBS 175.79]
MMRVPRCTGKSDLLIANMAQLPHHYRMPTELVLHIGTYLSPADYLSLEASCRHFRYMLQTETTKISDAFDRRKFFRRIKRDICSQAARAEIEALEGYKEGRTTRLLLSLENLFCSYCLSPHLVQFFSLNAVLESPFNRDCRGAAGVLRVCQHREMTFTEVRKAIPAKAREKYLCSHRDHYRDSGGPCIFDGARHLRKSRAAERWVLINPVYFHCQHWSYFNPEPLRLSISKIKVYLCQHLTPSSQAFFDLMYAPIRKDEDCCVKNSLVSESRCPHKDCNTRFTFRDLATRRAELEVSRALGNLLEPTSKKWLSHVQVATTTSSRARVARKQ